MGLAEKEELMKEILQILTNPYNFLTQHKLLKLIAFVFAHWQILTKNADVHRLYIYKNKITEYSGLVLNTGKEGETCL
jgi:hypothetical protein